MAECEKQGQTSFLQLGMCVFIRPSINETVAHFTEIMSYGKEEMGGGGGQNEVAVRWRGTSSLNTFLPGT